MAGIIVFDMLYIPPQPKKVASWVICELEHPQVHATGIYRNGVGGGSTPLAPHFLLVNW